MKKPGMPKAAVPAKLRPLNQGRRASSAAGGTKGEPAVARFQNSFSRSTRRSGGLPAIRVELIAPIDTPVTQSGCRPAAASASKAPAW